MELELGREMSWPIDGSCFASSTMAGGDLIAGRSKALRIEGRRKQSLAWGLGRMDVEAVVCGIRDEKRVAFLVVLEVEFGNVE